MTAAKLPAGVRLAAKLRLGEPVPPQVVGQVLDEQNKELVALRLHVGSIFERLKRLPSRGMSEGYALIRREDALKAVTPWEERKVEDDDE